MTERQHRTRLVGIGLVLALALAAGCAPAQDSVSSQPPPQTPPAAPEVVEASPQATSYAAELGGSSHEGEMLYLVIGATVTSEAEALGLLEDALPLFGDMQPYFIVQASDSFEPLTAGQWVIVEAYRDEPSPENLEFGRRAFPDARVERVTVRTSAPIPVYEDLVGE